MLHPLQLISELALMGKSLGQSERAGDEPPAIDDTISAYRQDSTARMARFLDFLLPRPKGKNFDPYRSNPRPQPRLPFDWSPWEHAKTRGAQLTAALVLSTAAAAYHQPSSAMMGNEGAGGGEVAYVPQPSFAVPADAFCLKDAPKFSDCRVSHGNATTYGTLHTLSDSAVGCLVSGAAQEQLSVPAIQARQ